MCPYTPKPPPKRHPSRFRLFCNPKKAAAEPVIVWNRPEAQKAGERPSYVMVKCGFWGEKEKGQLQEQESEPTENTGRGKSVTVRNGDSLGAIARRNHTTVSKLRKLNGLRNDNIRAGQKLKVR